MRRMLLTLDKGAAMLALGYCIIDGSETVSVVDNWVEISLENAADGMM